MRHPSLIIAERDRALDRLYVAVAFDLSVPVARGVVAASERWRVVEEAEARYRDWARRSMGDHKPVIRGRVDVELANLYGIDYQPAF
jgi:hypothetical protein